MSYKLFIDDERSPPKLGEWRIARNSIEALLIIRNYGFPNYISFDHDLGENEPTGFDIVKTLIDLELNSEGEFSFPSDFDFYVHSQNPVGKANIEGLLNQYLKITSRNP